VNDTVIEYSDPEARLASIDTSLKKIYWFLEHALQEEESTS